MQFASSEVDFTSHFCHRYHFINAVTKNKTTFGDRYARVLEPHELAIEIYGLAHLFLTLVIVARSFEQQPQTVPSAAENACDGNLLQGYHRELAIGFAFELDSKHADFLSGGNRREQRLLCFDACLQLLARTF